MIEALIAGQSDPAALAKLAHHHIRATPGELEAALHGRVTAHHRFLLRLHLDHLDALETAIASIDKEVEGNFDCFRTAVALLSSIPGLSQLSRK